MIGSRRVVVDFGKSAALTAGTEGRQFNLQLGTVSLTRQSFRVKKRMRGQNRHCLIGVPLFGAVISRIMGIQEPYEAEDIGMPEWGVRYTKRPSADNRGWRHI